MKTKINRIRTKTGFPVLVFFLLSAVAMQAQENEQSRPAKLYGGFGFFSAGAETFNVNALNNDLSKSGYGKINEISPVFGGGGSYVIKNFVIGGGGNWLALARTNNTANNATLRGGYGFSNFGYIFKTSARAFLYPTVGIGGGGYTLLVTSKHNTPGFSQQLDSPSGILSAETGGWILNLNLTYQMFLQKSTAGYFVALKCGYKYSPNTWEFRVHDQVLQNSPGINMNGFLLSLIFGGGAIQ